MLIGNDTVKRQLYIASIAAKKQNTSMPHILFGGAPGCGKTSMARFIAKEANVPFLSAIPDDMDSYKKIVSLFKKLNHDNYDSRGNRTGPVRPTIVWFDEIHRMPLVGQEIIGIAMENFLMESGKPNKYVWLPYFTVAGATTRAGDLSKPFRDRFKLTFNFEPYELDEMTAIVEYHSKRHGLEISKEGMEEIARRSRGTPRTAVGFIERVRDRALVEQEDCASLELIASVFKDMGVDPRGFTNTELKIMSTLLQADQPVGLDNLAIITGEDRKTLKDVIEPFLIKEGMVMIGGKGRVLTDEGRKYLKDSGELFKEEVDFDYKRI